MGLKTMDGKMKLAHAAVLAGTLLSAGAVQAGAKFAIDDTKWLSIGAGLRGSFTARENGAPNGSDYSKDFAVDNARIYINGQIHKYIKFEFNTECFFCSNANLRNFDLLDGIAKFEFNPWFNIWGGRLLVPSDRAEMSGPFYANIYDFNKTPFYSSDFSVTFGDGGAGVYGRDHGVVLWGSNGADGPLQYAFGVTNGLRSATGRGPNQDDNLMYSARIAYNFWAREKNPGYYTSSTYYGGGGDILTLGYAIQYQKDGAGTFFNRGDFVGMSMDLLMEKVLSNKGVITIEGEFKHFDAGYSTLAFTDADRANCFCMFDGDAGMVSALYLFPQKVGIGRFQPYVRYTANNPNNSSDRDEIEGGVNYIIDGHNARISLFYEHGDIATKGLNYAPTATGRNVDAIKLAIQLQL